MPNNKKNRKNKEKKAARAAAATAAVGPTVAEQQWCCHNPAACDKCALAFPPGCLHSLRQDERMSPEMHNEVIPVFYRFHHEEDNTFWDHPVNAPFANERMVRFFFYESVKIIVGKDSLLGNMDDGEYKTFAKCEFYNMIKLYGVLKCGSFAAAEQAFLTVAEDIALLELNQDQLSVRAMFYAFENEYQDCYHRFVYFMNEISPCNCLETEVQRAKEEAEEEEGRGSSLLECSNDDCDKKETCDMDPFSCCAGCKMAQYCSRRCYKDHWRGDTTSPLPHKTVCEAIQELKSVLAGGSIRRASFGGDDSA